MRVFLITDIDELGIAELFLPMSVLLNLVVAVKTQISSVSSPVLFRRRVLVRLPVAFVLKLSVIDSCRYSVALPLPLSPPSHRTGAYPYDSNLQ